MGDQWLIISAAALDSTSSTSAGSSSSAQRRVRSSPLFRRRGLHEAADPTFAAVKSTPGLRALRAYDDDSTPSEEATVKPVPETELVEEHIDLQCGFRGPIVKCVYVPPLGILLEFVQVANLLYTRVNSALYPQRDGK